MEIKVTEFKPASPMADYRYADVAITFDQPGDELARINLAEIIAEHLGIDQSRVADLEWVPMKRVGNTCHASCEFKIKPDETEK